MVFDPSPKLSTFCHETFSFLVIRLISPILFVYLLQNFEKLIKFYVFVREKACPGPFPVQTVIHLSMPLFVTKYPKLSVFMKYDNVELHIRSNFLVPMQRLY